MNIYILGGFPVAGMRKKNDVKKKKKKKEKQRLEWATAHFSVCVGSRYSRLYRDTSRLGKAGRQRAGACHDTAQRATIRPRYGQAACDTA